MRCTLPLSLVVLTGCHLHESPDIKSCEDAPLGCGDADSGDLDDEDGDGVPASEDCDDGDPEVGGPQTYYVDSDDDGWGDAENPVEACEQPDDAVPESGDCDDTSDAASPDIAEEICDDGLDNNCNGSQDDCIWSGDTTTGKAQAYLWTDTPASYSSEVHPLLVHDDLSGDGIPEIVLGQLYAYDGKGGYGAAYVFEGDSTGELEASQAYAVYTGEVTDFVGVSLAAGDLNGDGQADLVTGVSGYSSEVASNCGAAAVFLGPLAAGGGALSSADYLLIGPAAEAQTGHSVAIGDVTGDGLSVISGAVLAGSADQGSVYVLPAGTTEDLSLSDAAAQITPTSSIRLGSALTAGDLDGDGIDELLIATTYANDYAGAVYVFQGPVTGTLTTDDAVVDRSSRETSAYFGDVLDLVGDVDGDGTDDLAIGAYKSDGEVANSGELQLFTSILTQKEATATLVGNAQVTGVGSGVDGYDFDTDGHADLVVGAWQDSSVDGENAGSARLFYGPITGTVQQVDAAAKFRPVASGGYLGRLVGAADVDSNGTGDVVVGSHYSPHQGSVGTGAWVFGGPGY